jgi:hypothetical protein
MIPSQNLSQPLSRDYFVGSLVSAVLPPPVSFEGANGSASLPVQLSRDYFVGSRSQALLPEAIVKGNFAGSAIIPAIKVKPVVFQQMMPNAEFKAMFPGGQRIIPTFGMTVPSGADKALMEPDIQESNKEK